MMDRTKKEKERQEVFESALRSYRTAVEDAFALQERTLEFTRSLLEGPTEALRAQTTSNRATLDALAEQSRRQQQALENLVREYIKAYANLLQAPFSYYQGIVEAMTAPWLSSGGASESRAGAAEPPLEGYDSMGFREVSEKLDGLGVEEVRQLRDYELQNKNRHTFLDLFDTRISGGSS